MCIGQVIRWKGATVQISFARLPELHFILRSIGDTDLMTLKRQGRFLWERYLSSLQAIIDTTLAVLRDRMSLPPPPIVDVPAVSVFSEGFVVSILLFFLYNNVQN